MYHGLAYPAQTIIRNECMTWNRPIYKKYTNPATGILDFCKQKLWPLPCSQEYVASLIGLYKTSGAVSCLVINFFLKVVDKRGYRVELY